MQAVLAIDIGTTTICGIAVTAEGEMVAAVERQNDSAIDGRPPGCAEQDPGRIRTITWEVLAALRERVDSVLAIGLTGQMHGMLCVDRANQPLTPLITWQDARCSEPAPGGMSWIERMRRAVPAGAWEPCGCMPASGYMGATLYWMHQANALPPGAARVAFIHDWVAASLIGQLPVTDPADAGSAGVFDLLRLTWNDEIIRVLGLPGDLLPPVRESGEVIGGLSAEAARQTGIATGTPVCNATGDNQASVLGSLQDVDRSVLINLGTGGQISWAVPQFVRAPGLETRYLPRRRYMLVGASLCGGSAYAWLNDTVRAWLGVFDVQVERERVYEVLNALAAGAAEDCGGLRVDTRLRGTRVDPERRGACLSISPDNFTPANLARAVLCGMVDELVEMRNGAGGAAAPFERVVASGNAVRKNRVLREILTARLGRTPAVPAHREEAAFGAALLAGTGAGVWPDLATAARCVRYTS